MPATNAPTPVDADPRTETLANDPSPPSLRRWTLGTSSSNVAASRAGRGEASVDARVVNDPALDPSTRTSVSPGIDCAALRDGTRRHSPTHAADIGRWSLRWEAIGRRI